jgi:hypothetical protein
MQYLNHAISLYQDKSIIDKLKIDYTLAEDKQEKQALRIALLNLGHRIKEDKQE